MRVSAARVGAPALERDDRAWARAVLVPIGLAAGFFSALFGIGGGFVIVPLLIVCAGFSGKAATATSLAAIGFIAVFGVVAFQAVGAIEWGPAALVALPGMAGVLAGTWLQHRIRSDDVLVMLLSGFLVVVATMLLLR